MNESIKLITLLYTYNPSVDGSITCFVYITDNTYTKKEGKKERNGVWYKTKKKEYHDGRRGCP